jgi:hypothetical protein
MAELPLPLSEQTPPELPPLPPTDPPPPCDEAT